MRGLTLFGRVAVALIVAASAGCGREPQPAAPDGAAQEIARALRERLDAYGRGDGEAWARYVAEDCLCGPSSKAALRQEIAQRLAGVKNWIGEVTDFEARVHGDVAAVRYRETDVTQIGDQRIGVAVMKAETYVRRDGRWLLLGGAETVFPADPPVAIVDPRQYDAYVGRYEYGPGVADVVTRAGSRLLAQPTGGVPEELLPETATTFFLKGQPWRYVFVADGGRVTSLRFRMYGQDLVARRVDTATPPRP